ncbi:MAG: hypothetical protein ABI565_07385 [Vicinamibacteria bacterium]
MTVASNWLATAWDQNCALHVMSPVAASLETLALRWTLELLRLPKDAAGAFVVGATMASFHRPRGRAARDLQEGSGSSGSAAAAPSNCRWTRRAASGRGTCRR